MFENASSPKMFFYSKSLIAFEPEIMYVFCEIVLDIYLNTQISICRL